MMRTIKRSLIVSSLFVVLPLSSSLVFAQTPPPAAAPATAAPPASPPPAAAAPPIVEPPPPAAPPAPAPEKKKGGPSPGLSLAPDTPQTGGRVTSPAEPPPVVAHRAERRVEVRGHGLLPRTDAHVVGPGGHDRDERDGGRHRFGHAAAHAADGARRELHRLALHEQPRRAVDRAQLQVRQRPRQGAGPDRVVQPDRSGLPPVGVEPGHQPGVHPLLWPELAWPARICTCR